MVERPWRSHVRVKGHAHLSRPYCRPASASRPCKRGTCSPCQHDKVRWTHNAEKISSFCLRFRLDLNCGPHIPWECPLHCACLQSSAFSTPLRLQEKEVLCERASWSTSKAESSQPHKLFLLFLVPSSHPIFPSATSRFARNMLHM